jgi:hypothetical protein
MKIVLLLGPSSAGKSTLCNALVKEHGWYTHGGDQVGEILQKERTPLILEKLREKSLFERLSSHMSQSEITVLATTGELNLLHDGERIKHQFQNPDFEGLEAILNQARFTGEELESLTHSLHEVGNVFKMIPMEDGLERMLDDVFELPPDASVIIDQVPPNDGDIKIMLHDFKEKTLERAKADGREIEFATVIAFCPPKALSARIQQRNEAANISGRLENKREGMFPFLQLSQLIAVTEADGALNDARTLSKMQLLLIALQHLSPEVGAGETKKAKAIFKAGAHEYRDLMKRFKLSVDNVTISHREDLGAHAMIDLSQDASPSDMAKELIANTTNVPPLSTGLH